MNNSDNKKPLGISVTDIIIYITICVLYLFFYIIPIYKYINKRGLWSIKRRKSNINILNIGFFILLTSPFVYLTIVMFNDKLKKKYFKHKILITSLFIIIYLIIGIPHLIAVSMATAGHM